MIDSILNALQQKNIYPHPVSSIKKLETHISWVLLTGEYAYKIKKPVNFGFLDYSTLEKRHDFCQKEIQLNQALAPDIYLKMVAITKTPTGFELDGKGEVVEYAIQMREFSQKKLLNNLLAKNQLTPEMVKSIAVQLAHFHHESAHANTSTVYGDPATVKAPVDENFRQVEELLTHYHMNNDHCLKPLQQLEQDVIREFNYIEPLLLKRKKEGFIRSCHGDLHLGNITLVNDHPVIFDCIEFNEYFRWTDVMADVGFLVMDLYDQNRPDLAFLFLNTYLVYTGDYEGLAVLPYYVAYRAMVRGKIQLFSIQEKDNEAKRLVYFKNYLRYVKLAQHYLSTRQPYLLMMHGLSGSGKSTLAYQLCEHLGAIVIHSDVERKRMYNIHPNTNSDLKQKALLYSSAVTEKTYLHLKSLAVAITTAGYGVIVDATFLEHEQRQLFIEWAESETIPYKIVHCLTDLKTLTNRINKRTSKNAFFSEMNDLQILKLQEKKYEPLRSHEEANSLTVRTDKKNNIKTLIAQLKKLSD